MVEISEDLLKEIYNELVCCRRLRERQLMDYISNNEDSEVNQTQINMFEECVEHTRELYESIKDKI